MKNGIRIVAGLVLLAVPALIPAGHPPGLVPAEKWVARYNGPANSTDAAKAIAMDASGNVYVTGAIVVSSDEEIEGFYYYDYATIKYGPNGKQVWEKRYNGPGNDIDYAYAIGLDDAGNVYVTGMSYSSGTCYDYATVKY